jgi:hypothetical protein
MMLYNDVGEDSKCSKSFSPLAAPLPKPKPNVLARFFKTDAYYVLRPTTVNKPKFEKQAPPQYFSDFCIINS